MTFLKAEWRKLALANYQVDPKVLEKYLPAKTELDSWNGVHYVSLVGFMFVNTTVLGLKIPFHVNFEEVNLRFYVKYKEGDEWRRGVVFIKEIVPRQAITFIANTLYKEHYETMEMKHLWEVSHGSRLTEYQWKLKEKWHSFKIESEDRLVEITSGSEAEFITEHYWGYTKVNERSTFEYEVTHPKWDCYPIKDYSVDVDFGVVYGDAFKNLNEQKPLSVMLAEGSEITVENKRKLALV